MVRTKTWQNINFQTNKWCHWCFFVFSYNNIKQLTVEYLCLFYLLFIELILSFPIGQKRTGNFRNQRLWRHLAADYAIIISRTLNVTGYHVNYDHDALFLRIIMSSSRALCRLPSFFFVQCIIKQFLQTFFVISLEKLKIYRVCK